MSIGRDKARKKFLKTKNLLRNLSSYLHKYIKYNQRCKNFIMRWYRKKHGQCEESEMENYYVGLVDWTSSLSLTNFQEYQKVWTEKS